MRLTPTRTRTQTQTLTPALTRTLTLTLTLTLTRCIFAEMIGRKALFPGRDYLHQLRLIIDVR